jgi:hexosaminidase
MIGWDEILDGGAPDSAVIMCWRGADKGVEAARQGHQVIMAPIWDTYLSRRQGSPYVESPAPGLLRMKSCYGFEPVTGSTEGSHVLGGEGCLWTEFVPDARQAEYMTWPRAMALAEVFWSPKGSRDWPYFAARVQQQFPYLDADSVKYARSIYDPIVTPLRGPEDSLQIALATEVPGLTIYYTFDGTDPDNYYPRYHDTPLPVPPGAVALHAVTYRNGRPAGRELRCPLAELRKQLAKAEKKRKAHLNKETH